MMTFLNVYKQSMKSDDGESISPRKYQLRATNKMPVICKLIPSQLITDNFSLKTKSYQCDKNRNSHSTQIFSFEFNLIKASAPALSYQRHCYMQNRGISVYCTV